MENRTDVLTERRIDDPLREVKCRQCAHASTVGQLVNQRGVCWQCGVDVCVYCGCSEEKACVHPDFDDLFCSWQQEGVCDFCFCKIAELRYNDIEPEQHKVAAMTLAGMTM